MGKVRNFRDDEVLEPLLDAIPKRKLSRIVRRALYDYFFKGENKVMLEDEDSYIETDRENEEVKVDKKIETVKEIKFDMFDD